MATEEVTSHWSSKISFGLPAVAVDDVTPIVDDNVNGDDPLDEPIVEGRADSDPSPVV